MPEHLTMNTVVHAAVRRDLARFLHALEEFPVGSQERGRQLETAWRNLAAQIDEHHDGEETIFWPAMREIGIGEELLRGLGGEHQRMMEALHSTESAVAALASDPSQPQVALAREAFDELHDVIETHFSHEERDLEPVMARSLDTEPLKRAKKEVQKRGGLVDAGVFVAWVLDDADPAVRSFFGREFPKPLIAVLQHVLGRPYRKVAAVWA